MKLIKNLLPSIVQIMLGYLLIPIISGLLSLFSQSGTAEDFVSFLTSLVSDVPVLGTMTDAITLCLTNMGSEQARLQMLTSVVSLSGWDMLAAGSIGMLSGCCFKLGKLIGIKGLPVLQSILAVVLGGMLTRFVSAYADPMFMVLLASFSVTLNVVLTILIADRKLLAVLWGLGCECVAGVFAVAYVAFLIMAMQGLIPSIGIWLAIQLSLIVPMALFLVVDLLFV